MPTIGLEFCTKIIDLKDGSQIKVQLFDTAGQEKYRSVISNYLRKALGVLLVYDITKQKTFAACQEFFNDIQKQSEPDCVTLLVGNKTDLDDQREVSTEEGRKFAMDNKMYFIETSAKTQNKVFEAFETLFDGNNLFNYIIYRGW